MGLGAGGTGLCDHVLIHEPAGRQSIVAGHVAGDLVKVEIVEHLRLDLHIRQEHLAGADEGGVFEGFDRKSDAAVVGHIRLRDDSDHLERLWRRRELASAGQDRKDPAKERIE